MCPGVTFLGITYYYWGYILAFAACFAFNLLWYRKKYGFRLLPAALMTALIIPFGYGLIILLSLVHHGGINWVRAVLFIPLAVYLICLILRTNYARTFDFLTPIACINHGVSHYFCVFQGCCYGYAASGTFSVWNQDQNARLFPIQLVEATSILLVGLAIVLYSRHKRYDTHGICYFIHMMAFGATRFVYEFFRDDTPVRWQLSQFQYYCIAEFLIGLLFVILIKYSLSHPALMERHPLLYREDVDELTRLRLLFRGKKQTAN